MSQYISAEVGFSYFTMNDGEQASGYEIMEANEDSEFVAMLLIQAYLKYEDEPKEGNFASLKCVVRAKFS